ncbi:MAG: cytochrome c biogenesis protein ResB [Chloroflexota bacterium]|nr:cytochrome c biogenesis protein ResB [Chloroflexota bacterium]
MITQTPRQDPWRVVWQVAISDGLLIVLLLAVATGLSITAWLPQIPLADPVAYARQLSEAQTRFGEAAQTMQTLGLFTITRSLGFRALLALLAGCLLLRLVENGDWLRQSRKVTEPAGEWETLAEVRFPDALEGLRHRHYRVLSTPTLLQVDRWPWADLFPPLAHIGGLLLLVGLLLTHLWGWHFEGVIVQNSERVTLPHTEDWVALDDDTSRVTHSPGIVAFVEERGPGVQVNATDGTGQPLLLQQAAEASPVTQLTLALTEDQHFAIPEAQLGIRLAKQPDHVKVHSPVLVQVYRSPPGRLVNEIVMEGDAELTVDDVTLEFTSMPYARVTATFNPGLWPTYTGIVLLLAGILGSIAWPVRRFWLREEVGEIKGTGDLPSNLAKSEGN